MRKNNNGFTLIELIVVLAIMAILTGASAISFSLISRQRVSNASYATKQMLQLAQTYTKTRDNCVVQLEGTPDRGVNGYIYIFDNSEADDESKWHVGNGPSNINKKITTEVVYELKTGGTKKITVDTDTYAKIMFDRATGGYILVTIKDGATTFEGYPQEIIFSNGEKKSSLILARETGVVTYGQ